MAKYTKQQLKEAADQMAYRLEHSAYCSDHPENAPEDDCPFCDDRIAYQAYARLTGLKRTDLPLGTYVPLMDIPVSKS